MSSATHIVLKTEDGIEADLGQLHQALPLLMEVAARALDGGQKLHELEPHRSMAAQAMMEIGDKIVAALPDELPGAAQQTDVVVAKRIATLVAYLTLCYAQCCFKVLTEQFGVGIEMQGEVVARPPNGTASA